MTKQAVSKYSTEQEARIRAEAPLNQAKATALAAEFGPKFTVRSVIAKAVTMKVGYERKAPVTKTGAPVEHKEAIVNEIASLVSGNLDGLDKAPKAALQALRDALVG